MVRLTLAFLFIPLTGCGLFGSSPDQSIFNAAGAACAIALGEVDADAGILAAGKVKAEGWVYVRRGDCSTVEIDMYKRANRL